MRTIEEIRAPFENVAGEVDMEKVGDLQQALLDEIAGQQILLSQVTGGENVALLEQWVTRTFGFLVDQIMEVLLELRKVTYGVSVSMSGDAYDGPTPDEMMAAWEQERQAMHQAINLGRLAGLYNLLQSKGEKKIEVVKG